MEGKGSSGGRVCGGFQGADAGAAVRDTSCEAPGSAMACRRSEPLYSPPALSTTVLFPQHLVKCIFQATPRCAQASALLRSFQVILKQVVAGLRLAKIPDQTDSSCFHLPLRS